MAGCMPRILVHRGKLGQSLKHRRQDKLAVTFGCGQNSAGDKISGVFQNPDKIVNLVKNVCRDLRCHRTARKQKHRHILIPLPQNLQNLSGMLTAGLAFLVQLKQQALNCRICADKCLRICQTFRNDDLDVLVFQLFLERSDRPGRRVVPVYSLIYHQHFYLERMFLIYHFLSPSTHCE